MGYEFIVVRFLTFGMRIADKVPEGMSLIVIADNRGVTGKKLTGLTSTHTARVYFSSILLHNQCLRGAF